jgi:hypothetical protein
VLNVHNGWKADVIDATMSGVQVVSFLSAGLAASMAFIIYFEIRSGSLLGAFHWLTRARYPRGFPMIVGLQILLALCLVLFATIFALAGDR